MKKSIILFILFNVSLNSLQSQIIFNPVLNEIDDRKEIKTFTGLDYMKYHEYFDKNGNLIFSKIYNEEREVLSMTYHKYTDKNELVMTIAASTISDLTLDYYDYSEKGVVKKYYCSRWNRRPYDSRTKKFLQEVNTIEKLLKHTEIKKLIKKKRKSRGKILLDAQDRKIKEINWRKKNDICAIISHKYDDSNNVIETTHVTIGKKKKEKRKAISEYDASGNRIKSKMLKLIAQNNGVNEWVVKDITQTKYNDQNQRVEQLSTFGFYKEPKSEKKTIWIYDEDHRLINSISFNEKGEKRSEIKYEYENNLIKHRYSINYEHMVTDSKYKTTVRTFEIELYKD